MTHDTPPKRIWEDRMTDLTRERIEEIKKRKSLFDRGEVVNFLSVGEAHDLARQLLATMDTLAEAQAAQAGVVERAAEMAAEIHSSLATAIRTLADPTGVKLLAEMRSERDELRRENGILRGNAKAQGLVDEIGATGKNRRKTEGKLARTIEGQRAALRKLQGVVERHKTRAEAAEAQLAGAQKREAGLREAMNEADRFLSDPLDPDDVICARDLLRAAISTAPTGEESNG